MFCHGLLLIEYVSRFNYASFDAFEARIGWILKPKSVIKNPWEFGLKQNIAKV